MSSNKINSSLIMMKECPYTASSRDVSENTPPSALEISLVRGFCTPRPSRLPSGFALGQSLGPRGAKSPPLGNLLGLGGCIFRYLPPLGSVRIHHCSTDNVHCPWRTRRISCMPWVSRVEDEEFYDIRIYQADQRSVITS